METAEGLGESLPAGGKLLERLPRSANLTRIIQAASPREGLHLPDAATLSFFTIIYRWGTLLQVFFLILTDNVPLDVPVSQWTVFWFMTVYVTLLTAYNKKLYHLIERYPALLAIDLIVVSAAMVLSGGYRNPWFLYSFSFILITAFFYKIPGGLVAGILGALAYLTSLLLNGWPVTTLVNSSDAERVITNIFGYMFVGGFLGYPSVLLHRLEESTKTLSGLREELSEANITLQHANVRLQSLNEVTRALQSTMNLSQILDLILMAMVQTLEFDCAVLGRVNEKTGTIGDWMYRGSVEPSVAAKLDRLAVDIDCDRGTVCRAVIEKIPINVRDAANEPGIDADGADSVGGEAFAVLPMIAKDKVVGVLIVNNIHTRHAITDDDIELLMSFAGQAALAVNNAQLLMTREEKIRQLASLYETAVAIGSTLRVEDILELVVHVSSNLTQVDLTALALLDLRSEEVHLDPGAFVVRGRNEEQMRAWLAKELEEAAKGIVDNAAATPVTLSRQSELGDAVIVAVPLQVKNVTIGVLAAVDYAPSHFNYDDVLVLTILGSHAAVAVENARLHAGAVQKLKETTVLYQVAQQLATGEDIEGSLDLIANEINQMLHYHTCTIYLADQQKEMLEPVLVKRAIDGVSEPIVEPTTSHQTVAVNEGVTGWVFTTGQALNLANVHDEMPSVSNGGREESLLAAPLAVEAQRIGVITITKQGRNQFTDEDLRLLKIVSAQAAVIVQNARLREETQKLMIADERNRIARDMHDTVAQSLYSIALNLQVCQKILNTKPESLREKLIGLQQLASESLTEVRKYIFGLRPSILEEYGLPMAIERSLEEFERVHGIKGSFRKSGVQQVLAPAVEREVFGVLQEALANVMKHSGATQVNVELDIRGSSGRLTVKDNGRGFDVDRAVANTRDGRSLGLTSMRERVQSIGGTLTVLSKNGEGSTLIVDVATKGKTG
ncbi:MAG: GAF domain-containing protein [Actinobacteria bacterium]|nr:MAG: GAF domain-containing protein [Actinomycetota bacterium]